MSLISYTHDQDSVILRVKILDSSVSTGAGKTGLTSSSTGMIISTIADNEATATAYTVASSNVETITTLGTYAAPTSGKCRFKEVDSTNHKGVYEIHLADARFAVSSAKYLLVSIVGATDAAECDVLIPLTQMDPYASELLADVVKVSGDSTAADNLEAMYDGTGYTADDTAPASRAQVDGIGAASGGSLNFAAAEDNTGGAIKSVSFVGSQTGTFANVEAEDGSYHVIDHSGNDIDIIYGFDVGGNRTAAEVTFKGFLNGGNDDMLIQAYDFVGSDWETRVALSGKNGTTNDTLTATLLSKHTGTGADLGKVYIRFEADGAMTSPDLNVDELLVSAVNIGQSVGYANGAVWVDTTNGVAGTEAYVNGTADNPVSTWANALTLASSVGLNRFQIAA